jgi:PKD repeat protein
MKLSVIKYFAFLFLMIPVLSCKKDNGVSPEEPTLGQVIGTSLPTADFTHSEDGISIQFTNTSLNSSTYEWSFGDGSSSFDVSPAHSYAQNGTYTVTLTASNGYTTNEKSAEIIVTNVPVFEASMYNSGSGYFTFSGSSVSAVKSASQIIITSNYGSAQQFIITLPINVSDGSVYSTGSCSASVEYRNSSYYLYYGSCSYSCSGVNITIDDVTSNFIKGTFTGNIVRSCSLTGYTIQTGNFAVEF